MGQSWRRLISPQEHPNSSAAEVGPSPLTLAALHPQLCVLLFLLPTCGLKATHAPTVVSQALSSSSPCGGQHQVTAALDLLSKPLHYH